MKKQENRNFEIPLVIFCGGQSTRMGDLTKSVPKHLLEVIPGYCVLDLSLRPVLDSKFIELIYATGKHREKIEAYVKNLQKIYFVKNMTICQTSTASRASSPSWNIALISLVKNMNLKRGFVTWNGDEITPELDIDDAYLYHLRLKNHITRVVSVERNETHKYVVHQRKNIEKSFQRWHLDSYISAKID